MNTLLHTAYFTKQTYRTKQECLDGIRKIQRSFKMIQAGAEEIISLTAGGHCLKFAKDKKSWVSQSVFGIDIDHLHGITVRRLLTRLNSLGLNPFAAFSTLSDPDPLDPSRVRLYFALDNPVTDPGTMQGLIRYVCDTIDRLSAGSVDRNCMDPWHLFFPGTVIYRAPDKVIKTEEHLPLSQILSSGHPVLLDRNEFLRSLEEQFRNGYGISGVRFHDIPLEPNPVFFGFVKNKAGIPTLQFSVPRAPSMICLHRGMLPSTVDIHRDRISYPNPLVETGDKRRKKVGFFKDSKSTKSTEDKLYCAKVNQYTFPLFQSYLCYHLSYLCQDGRLNYDELKKNPENLSVLREIFPVETEPVTLAGLKENVKQYRQFFLDGVPETYPSLRKLFSTARSRTFTALLSVVLKNLDHLRSLNVTCDLQHVISAYRILAELGRNTDTGKAYIINLIRFFHRIGLIRLVDAKHLNAHITRGKYGNYPTVATVPYFDEMLLARAERKAKAFLDAKQTVLGCRTRNTKQNESYLSVKHGVIFLLDNEHYFTRNRLVDLVEKEGISAAGRKGNYMVDRYLPAIVKELRLHRQYCRSSLIAILPGSKIPRPGSSIIYSREDLYQNVSA